MSEYGHLYNYRITCLKAASLANQGLYGPDEAFLYIIVIKFISDMYLV